MKKILCFLMLTLPSVTLLAQSIEENVFATLEKETGVKIGLAAINTNNNELIMHRADERFAMGSTFKMMVGAAVLQKSMTDPHWMNKKIMYSKKDLLSWAPVTKKNLNHGMTVFDLTAATLMYSDSPAANLLMQQLGGPQAITDFARSIGDHTFRLDHYEPVNTTPGIIDDTTTPKAMMISLQKLAFENILDKPQREQLLTWMKNNTTGDLRIRAGTPSGWIVADKTGSGNYGVRNDIGIIWPPQCKPIVLAIYTTQYKEDAPHRDEVLSRVTRLVLEQFAQQDLCLK